MAHPIIRTARPGDEHKLLEMGQRFVTESIYGRLFAIDLVGVKTMLLLAHDQGTVFVADLGDRLVGMMGLTLVTSVITGEDIVEEIAWYVEPEHRKGRVEPLLLGAAEAWATTKSASMLKLIAPAGSDVGRFLERRGYTAVEMAYLWRPPKP